MAIVLPVDTPSLGNRSYLAHDGRTAVVVDPQRDIDRVLSLAEQAGVRIAHVVETHIHNDYVTGGFALAQTTGAEYHVNAADRVTYDRSPIGHGDVVQISPTMQLRAIATPGHTFSHLAYALAAAGPDGTFEPVAVFTGGSLLYGATGRPDLLGAEHTRALARHQYASAQRLAAELPAATQVWPTHGFGSFCSSRTPDSTGPTRSARSTGSVATHHTATLGGERRTNPVLTEDLECWVADTLAGLDAYPAYYAHMAPANAAGPAAADLSAPAPAGKADLARRIAAGEWVVDLRHRTAFAAAHLPGALNIGLDGQFATYLGWLIPWGTPVTLLGESADQVAQAQRELTRIGIDRPAGAATGRPADWTDVPPGRYRRADFAELAQVRRLREVGVLDVRLRSEYAGGHIVGAVNVPLHELLARLDDVARLADGGPVWVHCASGYRASIAASMLAARGIPVVTVDDDFTEQAAGAGLPIVTRAA